MKTLNVEELQVDSFATEPGGDRMMDNTIDTWCTQLGCPGGSQEVGCTERCIAPSSVTEAIRCCG